jgi:hypothetical protein
MQAQPPKEGPASRRRDGRPWYERPYGLATLLIVLLVGFVTVIGMGLIGWLALPLIGVIGLLISARLQINDGDAVPDFHYGSTGVYLMTLQDKARSQLPREQSHHHAFERRERRRLLKAVNGIWIAYCVLGFVMYARQNDLWELLQ